MPFFIIKEKNNALFGDCYFVGPDGYTTNKGEDDRFETKEEAKGLLTEYFTEEDLKAVRIIKVKG